MTAAATRPLLPRMAESGSDSTRRATARKLGATVAVILLGLVVVAVSAGTRAVAEGESSRVELDAFPEGEMETRFGVAVHEDRWERQMDKQMMDKHSKLYTTDRERSLPPWYCFSQPDRCNGRTDWNTFILSSMALICICFVACAGACSLQDKGHFTFFKPESSEEEEISNKYHAKAGLSTPTPHERAIE